MKERRTPVIRRGITGFFCLGPFFSPLFTSFFAPRSLFARAGAVAIILLVLTFSPAPVLATETFDTGEADAGKAGEIVEIPGVEEEVVVTAARLPLRQVETPGLTVVVDREEIRQSTGSDLPTLIAEAGFPVAASGGDFAQSSVQLGGFSANQSLVMFNGIPVNPGPVGQVDLSLFPAAVLDRVEISRGPLSPLYGANAMGGVVNIETALSGEERSGFLLSGGSFGSGEMNLFLKRRRWGLAAGGSGSAGYLPNSASRKSYFSGEYNFSPAGKNSSLVLQGHLLTKDAETPPTDAYPFPGNQSDQRYILNLRGKNQTVKNLWEYQVFTQSWANRYKDDLGDDRHQVEGYGAEFSVRREEGRHILLAGLSLTHDSFDSTKSGLNSRSYGGVFLQDFWALRQDLVLLTGLRWDTSSDYGAALSPRVNLIKYLTKNLSLKAGYGRAFRPPTVNELYWHDPQWGMFGNPDLRPEKGESYDLTLHWQDRTGNTLAAGVFRSRLTDGISWVQETETFVTRNIARVEITGFDLRWERKAKNGFGGDLNYTWLNREDWNPDTGYAKNIPLGQHRLAVGVTFARGPWLARACWQLVAGRTPQLGQAMPDYHLLDTALIYRTRNGYDLKLAVNNLLDTAYEISTGYPMPGRNLEVSIYYAF